MGRRPLDNYLRTYRRRRGFFQDEIAFLLGCDESTVARHERDGRKPTLEMILGYEVLHSATTQQLFAGTFHDVQGVVKERAAQLIEKVRRQPDDPLAARKLEVLAALAGMEEPITIPLWDE